MSDVVWQGGSGSSTIICSKYLSMSRLYAYAYDLCQPVEIRTASPVCLICFSRIKMLQCYVRVERYSPLRFLSCNHPTCQAFFVPPSTSQYSPVKVQARLYQHHLPEKRKKKAAKTPVIPNLFLYQLGLSLGLNLCISVLRSRARDLISPCRRASTISSRYARGKDLSLRSDLI